MGKTEECLIEVGKFYGNILYTKGMTERKIWSEAKETTPYLKNNLDTIEETCEIPVKKFKGFVDSIRDGIERESNMPIEMSTESLLTEVFEEALRKCGGK